MAGLKYTSFTTMRTIDPAGMTSSKIPTLKKSSVGQGSNTERRRFGVLSRYEAMSNTSQDSSSSREELPLVKLADGDGVREGDDEGNGEGDGEVEGEGDAEVEGEGDSEAVGDTETDEVEEEEGEGVGSGVGESDAEPEGEGEPEAEEEGDVDIDGVGEATTMDDGEGTGLTEASATGLGVTPPLVSCLSTFTTHCWSSVSKSPLRMMYISFNGTL